MYVHMKCMHHAVNDLLQCDLEIRYKTLEENVLRQRNNVQEIRFTFYDAQHFI